MKNILKLLSLALMILIGACTEDTNLTPTQEENVPGIVQTENGEYIVDAVVTALRGAVVISHDTTDDFGAFSLKGIPAGYEDVDVSISHPILGMQKLVLKSFKDKIKSSGKWDVKWSDNDSCCGVLNVTVRNKTTNDLMSGVHVKIGRGNNSIKAKSTLSDGLASFDHLCPGEYWIRVYKEGFKVIEDDILIVNCEPINITTLLEAKEQNPADSCCNGIMAFVLKDSTTNNPLKNVRVKLWKDGKILNDVKTSENGMYVFTGLCPGNYGVSYFPNDKGFEFNFTMECNDTLEIVKKYAMPTDEDCCSSKVIVHVKNSNTQGNLDGAKVRLWKNGTMITYKMSENGKVTFENICEGNYAIDILKEGFKGVEFAFEIGCPETKEFEKFLSPTDSCCNGKIKVIVRDSVSRQGLANLQLKLMQNETVKKEGKTNADGFYYFENVCEGSYKVMVKMPNNSYKEQIVQVPCNETKVLEFEYKTTETEPCTNATLKLRIKDIVNSLLLDSAEVKIRLNGNLVTTVYSNVEGWAIAQGLMAPATYSILISKQGYKSKEISIQFKECKIIQETIILEEE